MVAYARSRWVRELNLVVGKKWWSQNGLKFAE